MKKTIMLVIVLFAVSVYAASPVPAGYKILCVPTNVDMNATGILGVLGGGGSTVGTDTVARADIALHISPTNTTAHAVTNIDGLTSLLAGKSDTNHNHDTAYYPLAGNPSNYIPDIATNGWETGSHAGLLTEATSLGVTNVTGGILSLIGRQISLVTSNLTAVLNSVYAAIVHDHPSTAITNAPWITSESDTNALAQLGSHSNRTAYAGHPGTGSAATNATADFATAAQGGLADTALQAEADPTAWKLSGSSALTGPATVYPLTTSYLQIRSSLGDGAGLIIFGDTHDIYPRELQLFSGTSGQISISGPNVSIPGYLATNGSASGLSGYSLGVPAMATSAAQAVVAPYTNQVTASSIAAAGGLTGTPWTAQGYLTAIPATLTPTTLVPDAGGTATVENVFAYNLGSLTQNVTVVLGNSMTNAAQMRGFWLDFNAMAFSITFPTTSFSNVTGAAVTASNAYHSYWSAGVGQSIFKGAWR